MKPLPPLGSLQGTWGTNWASKQLSGASQAPVLLPGWNNSSLLSVHCLDFLLRETYPGCPHGPLWPPSPVAFPLRSSSLSSQQLTRGVRDTLPSRVFSETFPNPFSVPHPHFLPRTHPEHLCHVQRWCPGLAGCAQGGAHKSWQGRAAALAENTAAYWQVCPQHQYISLEEIPQGKDNNLLYQIITWMSQDCKQETIVWASALVWNQIKQNTDRHDLCQTP